MINLSTLNQNVAFVIGLMLVGVYFWMLTDRVASRIRNSKLWFVGWFGALMILSAGGKLMMPVLDKILSGVGASDETLVPIMFGSLVLLTMVIFFVQIYQLRRQIKQG